MAFLLRRLAFYLVAFAVAATINFILPRLMPGNPVDIMFSDVNSTLPPEAKQALIETFGFASGPLHIQFLDYMRSVFTLDFGLSVRFYPLTVGHVLEQAFWWTLFLVGVSSFLSFTVGSLLGVFAAWRRGGPFDSFISPGALAVQSIPAVIIALLLLFTFGTTLAWLPTGYAHDPAIDPGFNAAFLASIMLHAVMPVVSLSLTSLGGYLINMRNNMIGQLGEDHVVMGIAKGLSDRRVRYNYAARNALLPSITSFSLSLGAVMGGSLVTEIVFNYPGLGNTLYLAIIARDYPLIQGQLLIMTAAMLTVNFLMDLAYVYLDPRMRRA